MELKNCLNELQQLHFQGRTPEASILAELILQGIDRNYELHITGIIPDIGFASYPISNAAGNVMRSSDIVSKLENAGLI